MILIFQKSFLIFFRAHYKTNLYHFKLVKYSTIMIVTMNQRALKFFKNIDLLNLLILIIFPQSLMIKLMIAKK